MTARATLTFNVNYGTIVFRVETADYGVEKKEVVVVTTTDGQYKTAVTAKEWRALSRKINLALSNVRDFQP